MKFKAVLFLSLFLAILTTAYAQQKKVWNGKRAAVVLTYDDAIDGHLDNVLPALDSLHLKATFYIIGSSPVTNNRMKEWRAAAAHGHELGNHSLCHPCDGSLPGRGFITPDTDLSKYTVSRAVKEIRLNNTLLTAIDGKTSRTFAYPCGDLKIGNTYFYNELTNDFSGARGVSGAMNSLDSVRLNNINSYAINGQNSDYMIALVDDAIKTNSLLVFLFHGVGGGHALNVDLHEHSKLLHYLSKKESDVWTTTMDDASHFVKKQRGTK